MVVVPASSRFGAFDSPEEDRLGIHRPLGSEKSIRHDSLRLIPLRERMTAELCCFAMPHCSAYVTILHC